MNSNHHSASRPLCVDLDGTLLKSNILVESVFALLKQNCLFIFVLPVWLLKGKAHLKQEIANRVDLDASIFPYHGAFLDYLKDEHANGRRLILATASNEKFAKAVAHFMGIFDEVLASDATTNLSGWRKLERLQSVFGSGGFDYAGNAMVDLILWRQAGGALIVNPERGVLREAKEQQCRIVKVFDDRSGHLIKHYLYALRLHQWLKNLLVFIPLFMAHRFDDPALLGQAILAFFTFGLCASSVYLLNDFLDLQDDRQHQTKRNRPFASGSISLVHGAMLIPILLVFAFGLALLLPIQFVMIVTLYYCLTLAYSLRLKQAALVDLLTLAGLYMIRIIAGGAAVGIAPSFWLLVFSMFFFMSLALVKRFTELLALDQQGKTKTAGRGYNTADLETLSQFGCASGYLAVLVLALYINSNAVRELYSQPYLIWLLCPLLLYIVTRIWLLARRGELHEDPIVFVIRDRRTQWLAAVGILLLLMAI